MRRCKAIVFLSALVLLLAHSDVASAQASEFLLGKAGGSMSGRIVQIVAILSILSIAPSLLVMTTSFTRFVVALSFLRSGLGLQNTPGNVVLISLALFLTFFVMSPTFEKAWREGVQPLIEQRIDEKEAADRIVGPFREFMTANVRESDVRLLQNLRPRKSENIDSTATDLAVLVPAFMISELRRGFEIGFLVALPFLVIDLIVATITMSMGMMMLPPSVIGLPIKVLFFVLIDGWSLLVSGLVRSYSA
ncbi:MAG: flagellar type III secretion system pore protein FliP [Rhodoblastus sp.]|nr:flagellar type III secretion system pore protein FliP [Rhodoblastus sp.]